MEVVRLAWPIVVSMLSYTAMGVTDTMFVGWVGKTELAAVGLATIAIFLVNSFFLGVLNGVKVVSAQATGASDPATARSAAWQGALLAIPFGVFVIFLGELHEPIFRLMGGTPEVRSLASDYFRMRVYASPFWYIFMAICNALQGTGDTRTPMFVNLVANGLNIALDPLLIFGIGPFPEMGVTGAALATVLACAGGMIAVIPLFIRKNGFEPRPDRRVMKPVLGLGLPIGVRFLLEVAGWSFFTALLARIGEDDLAANQIAINIIKLSFLPGYAISEAACILTGKHTGARNPEGIRDAFHASLKVAVAVMAFFGVLFWLVPDLFLTCFQDDPAVLAIGRDLLLVAALFQIFDAVAMVGVGALNGVGDTRFTMVATVLATWLVLVPLTYLLGMVSGLGAFGAWLALTAEITVLAAVLLVRFYGRFRPIRACPAPVLLDSIEHGIENRAV